MIRKTIILGGGTFQPIRNHLSLAAPAFGNTARQITEIYKKNKVIYESYLTKMAENTSNLITNEDVEKLIDKLLLNEEVGTIILNVAFCDYTSLPIDNIENNSHAERLLTSNGNISLELTPTDKIISKIRKQRPDIFLVGFKTTTNKTEEEQFSIGLKMMKSVKCNLLFCNDTITRNNFIITAEETIYKQSTREETLKELVEMTIARSQGNYNPTNFIKTSENVLMQKAPKSFQEVIQFLVDNRGFMENNGNGFTPGHFCYKTSETTFVSSQRKANHNEVFKNGMSLVIVKDDKFTVVGDKKASVGARSQWMIFKENPGYDCIIHTHNPLKLEGTIKTTPQKMFQCGSLECGINTVSNMDTYEDGLIRAVYLDKHGANILFNSNTSSSIVIDFIKKHLNLGIKTT